MSLREPFEALAGTTAVVTGGARGIGLEIARALHEVGTHVLLVDLDPEALTSAAAGLTDGLTDGPADGRVAVVTADLTTEAGQLDVDAALGPLPPLSVWVNNAGVVSHQLSHVVDQETFERVVRTNAWGAIRGSQTAWAHMQHEGPRSIVNITSLVLDKTVPERVSYAASKAALASATRYAALDWGPLGIRVNAVSPGYVDTRLTDWPEGDPRLGAKRRSLESIPLGQFGLPGDIASVVLFLASPLAAYVTGETVFVDGGWALT